MSDLARVLNSAAADGVFSGAVLRVEDLASGQALGEWPAGRVSSQPPGAPVHAGTLFDLASLTKLFAATVTLRLVDRGVLELDESLRLLLEHRSGLPAWQPYFQRGGDVLAAALEEPLVEEPGAVHCYSDVGFLHLLERLQTETGKGIEELVRREVIEPLRLEATSYRDVGGAEETGLDGTICATEHCPRRGLLVGEVNDGNTWAMGGRSTHAGLFGTASDLARFAGGWWRAADLGFISSRLCDAVWASPPSPGTHVLGWDTVAPAPAYSSVGSKLSRKSRGHLGFTGTSFWIDPERAIAVILLTNRVHPLRSDNRIREFRPLVHDLVADFVDEVR